MSTRPNTQSELTVELSDPELSGALLNSVNSFLKERKSHYCSRNKKSKVSQATGDQTMLGTAR